MKKASYLEIATQFSASSRNPGGEIAAGSSCFMMVRKVSKNVALALDEHFNPKHLGISRGHFSFLFIFS